MIELLIFMLTFGITSLVIIIVAWLISHEAEYPGFGKWRKNEE